MQQECGVRELEMHRRCPPGHQGSDQTEPVEQKACIIMCVGGFFPLSVIAEYSKVEKV